MWSRLDDGLLDHAKVAIAGDLLGPDGRLLVIGMFAVGLMWTNKQLTDGFLPFAVVKQFRHCRKPIQVADALVRANLWHAESDGYRIHDFHQYNDPAAAVREERVQNRWRKQLYADRQLVDAVRNRDANRCRVCGQMVEWKDRRGERGGLFVRPDPSGPTVLGNVITVCRRCARERNGAEMLPAGSMGKERGI